MLQYQIYVTGTVRGNRKGLPDCIKKQLKVKCDIVAVRKEQLLCIAWMDRKQVCMLSPHAKTVQKERYDKSIKTVPSVVVEYNAGMGGVDELTLLIK